MVDIDSFGITFRKLKKIKKNFIKFEENFQWVTLGRIVKTLQKFWLK